MPFYRHSSNPAYCRVVHCSDCDEPMDAIYDPSIRDTCKDCGGHALTDNDAAREEIRREQLAKVREARHLATFA